MFGIHPKQFRIIGGNQLLVPLVNTHARSHALGGNLGYRVQGLRWGLELGFRGKEVRCFWGFSGVFWEKRSDVFRRFSRGSGVSGFQGFHGFRVSAQKR